MKVTIVAVLFASVAAAQNRPSGAIDYTVASVANLPAQKISANDLIGVAVYNAPELTRTFRVGEDGTIGLPMITERIKAEGLLPSELEAKISGALKTGEILVEPVVTVTILEYNSRTVSVMGAVKRPVTFQAIGRVTVLDALARAEGLTADAGPDILLNRLQPAAGNTPAMLTQRIPVRQLIDAADPAVNFILVGGEEIRVPEARKIYVVGNVKKPGPIPVRDGSETTVLKALSLAEGLSEFPNKTAYIYRGGGESGAKQEIPVELDKIMRRKAPDVPLMADDLLYVPDNRGKRIGVTTLEKTLLLGSAIGAALIYAGVR
jgi:polysaccharide biosynthesis/export protein